MKTMALVLGVLLLGVADGRAQTPTDLNSLVLVQQPLPAGELVTQAPDAAQWTVSSTDLASLKTPADPAHPAPKPAVSTVTKSNKIYLVESVDAEGVKIAKWKTSQFQATYLPGVTSPMIAYDPSTPYFVDFSKSDFPEFSWISARNYVGVTKLGGTAMGLVFKGKVGTRGPQMTLLSTLHATPSEAVAVIDLATRQPVMIQVDNELLRYQFSSGASDLSLPLEVQQAFDSLRKRIHRASLLPPS